jgi:5-methylthioadenosine/S-adenosylhomocysteine deaminase
MLQIGIAVGLGTDGVAGSNNDVDMFEEMDLAAKLQKVNSGDPTALPAEKAFDMATILGAQALKMGDQIGSLEPGKRADIISIRLNAPNAAPLYNVYSQLVYALKSSDVGDVMVNGRIIVGNRHMLTIDDKAVMAKAEEYRAQVSKSLGGN